MDLTREIELVPIKVEERNKLENLMALYLHDLSEYAHDLKINTGGKFEYEGLDLYFNRSELKPFFIYYKNELVGFIFLNTGRFVPENIDYSLHELFLLKGFRRKGVAAMAVKRLFEDYKGSYKIEQLESNNVAINFWNRIYKKLDIKYTETKEIIEGLVCYSQIFKV